MAQLLDQESFAAYVEAATRQAGFPVEKREGLALHIVVHNQPMRCNLETAFSAYQRSPHRLDEIVQVHLEALRKVPPPSPLPAEKEAAESLLPLLNRAEFLRELRRPEVPPPAHRPFVAGLIITYVFDLPHHRAYVNETMLASMTRVPDITLDHVHEYALENLRRRTSSRDYRTYGSGHQTIVACETQDGYAATRILLPDLMETWASRIPGRMLLGIPNRDFLIAFSDRDPRHVAAITRQVRRDTAQRDRPLSASLLVWQKGRIREYQPKH